MGMIGAILLIVSLATAILYARLKQGCFFKPRFKNDFPEELKPYMGKNYIGYGTWEIKPFVERYKEAKRKHFFSLERFLDGEKKLMRMKRKFRRWKKDARKRISKKMAALEIGWWQDHHRKNKEGLTENMAKLYTLLFNISYEDAVIIVKHRVEAAKLHDEAEKNEDNGHQKKADVYWEKAEEELQEHFALLEQSRKR